MNRHDLQQLKAVRAYPCLTITLPTHRTSPDNRQDPIRLRNLVRQASGRLTGELGKREVARVLAALDALAADIDHEQNLDGLALFVSAELARSYRLPFALPERVIVDDSFFIRDMVYALNRSPRYWVLALSEQPTRLFEATRDDLAELADGSPFPMTYGERGGEGIVPREPAINTSALRDDFVRAFYRNVDRELGAYLADDPLPVAIVGVDRAQAFFREVTRHSGQIVTALTGSHSATTAHELGKLVWPLVKESLAAQRQAIFGELNAAVGAQRSSSTLYEVWRLAQEGRGATLVVEEGYHEPAVLDERGMLRPPATGEAAGPSHLDDAVDEVIATVLTKGGRVVFVDDGTLAAHSRIALILRY